MTDFERDPLMDNLKFLLILMVVLGHFIAVNAKTPIFKGLSLFIYSFLSQVFFIQIKTLLKNVFTIFH